MCYWYYNKKKRVKQKKTKVESHTYILYCMVKVTKCGGIIHIFQGKEKKTYFAEYVIHPLQYKRHNENLLLIIVFPLLFAHLIADDLLYNIMRN